MRRLVLSLLPLAAFTLCSPAFAGQGPKDAPADEGDSVEYTLALKVVKLATPESAYRDMMRQMSAQMTAAIETQGGKLPPDFEAKMPIIVEEALPYDELVEFSATLYAERFTADELEQLAAFYETPLGQKMVAEMPGLMAESSAQVGALIPRRLPELMKKHGRIP